MDPISAGLGAVSLISGKQANKKAQDSANAAAKGSKALEQRAITLWDTLFNRAKQAEQQGVFDPEKQIAALESDTSKYEAKDLGNLAGALTTAGYRPGDSEIGTRLDAVKGKYRQFLDNMREQIRTNSWQQQQAAYQSANPQYLQGALNSSNNRQAVAQSQVQNPSGFLANLLPSILPSGGSSFKIGDAINAGKSANAASNWQFQF